MVLAPTIARVEEPAARPGRRLGKRPGLTGLRGLAWILVFAGHAELLRTERLAEGAMFLFFALSGFLITELLVEERMATGQISLHRFFARRGLRLVPALVAFLAVWVLVVAVFSSHGWLSSVPGGGPGAPVKLGTALGGAGLALAYVLNWGTIAHVMSGYVPIGHLWSLSVEEQFYVFWAPIVAVVLAARSRRALAGLAALLATLSIVEVGFLRAAHAQTIRLTFGTDVRSGAFLAGAVAALVWQSGAGSKAWRAVRSLLNDTFAGAPEHPGSIVLGLLVVMLLASRLSTALRSPLHEALVWAFASVAAAGAVVVAASTEGGVTGRFLGGKVMTYLGTRSYALYLWHYVWLTWFAHLGSVRIPLALAATLACAELSWRLVEEPALSLKRRFEPGFRREADPYLDDAGDYLGGMRNPPSRRMVSPFR
jgi:peptidoglycan/LPS O-acetylase OafA/YrhL